MGKPSEVSRDLSRLADYIDSESKPSKRLVRNHLVSVAASLGRLGLAALKPSIEPADGGFELLGAQLPPLFHAASGIVTKIDAPWEVEPNANRHYGQGFYAAFSPDYVRKWYGPVVTRLRATPEAKVLIASVDPKEASPGLMEKVLANEAARIGDEAKFEEFKPLLLENQIFWVQAIDRLAIEEYEIVVFSDEQIVVKNPAAVIIEGEEKPKLETSFDGPTS